jgi:hypothetical protein
MAEDTSSTQRHRQLLEPNKYASQIVITVNGKTRTSAMSNILQEFPIAAFGMG